MSWSSTLLVILVFAVLFSLLFFASTYSNATVLTTPTISEDDAIAVMNADLRRRVSPALLEGSFIYGRNASSEVRQLPLVYIHRNTTQFYINGTNGYVIDAQCTPSPDFRCFIGERIVGSIQGYLTYVVDGGWVDSMGRSSPMYYYIDAKSGKILWSYVGEDVYPELEPSE